MAIYHLSMKIIGGGSGRTAMGAALYRRGEKLHNEHDNKRNAMGAAAYHRGDESHDGKTHLDYTKKRGIVYSEIMLPKYALLEYMDSQILWNAAQNAEKQHNARTAKEIVIALPNELSMERNIEIVREYVKENFVDEGMCADYSFHAGHIHTRKGEVYPFEDLAIRKENPHVHIQLTVRPLNKDGTFCKTKTRKEYILDKNGERIRTESGKGWVSRNVGLTDWDKRETLLKWRENWAKIVNKEFERLGIDERISHLSLEEQGIDREPTKHMGHKAWALECKGKKTEIGEKNRAIMQRNITKSIDNTAEYMHELKQGYVTLDKEISLLQQENDNDERGQLRADRIKLVNENAGILEQIFSIERENEGYLQQMSDDGKNIREITQYRIDIQGIERDINTLILEEMNTSFFKINQRRNLKEQIKLFEDEKKKSESLFEKKYGSSFENAAVLQDELRANLLDMQALTHKNDKQSMELKKQQSDNDEKIQQLRAKEIEIYQKRTKHIQKLYEEKEEVKLEYQIKKQLVDISPHRQKIYDKLAQLDRETHASETLKERRLRIQSESVLEMVTERERPERPRTIERYM